MVWSIFFYVWLLDRRGGLKLFEQFPYRTNTLKKRGFPKEPVFPQIPRPMVDHPQQSPELFDAYNKEPRPLQTGRRALASSAVWCGQKKVGLLQISMRRRYYLVSACSVGRKTYYPNSTLCNVRPSPVQSNPVWSEESRIVTDFFEEKIQP